MRRLKKGMLLLVTLLLVAAGAAMPFITSYMQDIRQTGADIRPLDSFSLTLKQEADLGRTLKLIAGADYYVAEMETSADVHLSEGEVLDAVQVVLKELTRYGLLNMDPAALGDPDIWPQLIISNDGSTIVPAWTISWRDSPEYIWLDDATGKAVMISLSFGPYPKNYVQVTNSEALYAVAENWRAFLEDYYGTEVYLSDEDWYDAAVQFALSFPLGQDREQEQANFQLDLYIYFADGFTTLSPYISSTNTAAQSR